MTTGIPWSIALSTGETRTLESTGASTSLAAPAADGTGSGVWVLADDLTATALLGTATTAMLVGHSYLVAPTMSLTPLLRLLTALFTAIVLRAGLPALGIWFWTAGHSRVSLEGETALWLSLRWGVGLVAPLVLGWMARESAKIRSTQSATGILYVAVICVLLGELTSQLLADTTGDFLL